MSTLKSSAEHLTLNADGSGNDIKFQSNATEVAVIDQAGNLTLSGTVDGVDIAARDAILTSTTTTAGAALPKAGGAISGNLSFSNTSQLSFGRTSGVASLNFEDASDAAIFVTAAQTTNYFQPLIGVGEGSGTFTAAISSVDNGAAAAQGLVFHTGDTNAITERMRIDSSGNVGIGVTPSYKLDVDAGAPSSADKVISRHMSETSRQLGLVWDDSASTLGLATLTNHSLSFHTNGINPRMIIDNTGRVTMPNQPSFRAYKTSSNTGGGLDWHGTYHNTGSHFSTSNGRFTAPVAGFYYISVHYLTDSDTNQTSVNLTLNGQANDGIRLRSASSTGHETTSASHVIYLNANDYILATFSGTVYGDSSYSWTGFSGHLLG